MSPVNTVAVAVVNNISGAVTNIAFLFLSLNKIYIYNFTFSLYKPTGLIQSLSRNVRLCVYVSVSVPLFAGFFNVIFLPFTKVKSPIDRLQKDSLGKSQ